MESTFRGDGRTTGGWASAETKDEIGDCSGRKNDEHVTGSRDIIQNEYQEQEDCDEG